MPINHFKPNCQFNDNVLNKPGVGVNVEEAFKGWNRFMWNNFQQSFLNLFSLMPENSPVNPETVRQPFISNMTVNFNPATIGQGY